MRSMKQSDGLTTLIKINLIRLQAYLILLQQDSELSREFFTLFHKWDPDQPSNLNSEKGALYKLCDQLYLQYDKQSKNEMSISDIVNHLWQNQPVFTDKSVEITDLPKLSTIESNLDSKHIKGNSDIPIEVEDVLIGSDPKWLEVLEYAKRVAESDFSVLICGETGVGKELIARRLHNLSRRSKNNCVVLNCAAFSEGLIESELFGYEANSFTGADPKGKDGWIGSADGGTLVLDEIADLSSRAQATILRAIESGELQKVGGKISKVDFRLISISNKPLDELVKKGKFRQDLYYRLAIVPLNIPPLRERVVDIMPLVKHFINKFQRANPTLTAERFSSEAVKSLHTHYWEGNVRELENVVARAMILCQDVEVDSGNIVFDQPQQMNEQEVSKKLLNSLAEIPQAGIKRLSRVDLANFLSSTDWFRSRDYAMHFNLSESTSHRHLSAFCDAGILERSGKERNRSYRLAGVLN